jgi:hypothetical protein
MKPFVFYTDQDFLNQNQYLHYYDDGEPGRPRNLLAPIKDRKTMKELIVKGFDSWKASDYFTDL